MLLSVSSYTKIFHHSPARNREATGVWKWPSVKPICRRFPDNHFPGQTFHWQGVSRKDVFRKIFMVILNTCSCSDTCWCSEMRQCVDAARLVVSASCYSSTAAHCWVTTNCRVTNCSVTMNCRLTNFWVTMNCIVNVWLYAAGNFLSLHIYLSFVIVLVCVAFIYHIIITRLYRPTKLIPS